MDQELTISIIALVISVIGVVYTHWNYGKTQKALLNDSMGRLYQQNNEIRMVFFNYPQLREYFFRDREISEDDSNYKQVLSVAEMILNYLEHLLIQKENIPEEQWSSWSDLIGVYYKGRPIIRSMKLHGETVCVTKQLQKEFEKHGQSET